MKNQSLLKQLGVLCLAMIVVSSQTTTDDLSGRVYEIETYQQQVGSPLEWQPLSREIDEGITEYGYSFWFKLDYLWKDDPKFSFDRLQEKIELAYLSENKDEGWDTTNPGSRTLALEILHNRQDASIIGSTYDLGSNEANANNIQQYITYSNVRQLDSEWSFVSFSYSSTTKTAVMALKIANQDWQSKVWSPVTHQEINHSNKLHFRLANCRDGHSEPGWNGQYRWVRFTYGADGSGAFRDLPATKLYFADLNQNVIVPVSASHSLSSRIQDDSTVIDKVSYVGDSIISNINDVNYPKNYAIKGWVKVPSDVTLDSEYRLIYRVSTKNTAQTGDNGALGGTTFEATINQNAIKLSTYSISDVSQIVSKITKTIKISKDDYHNDIYIYHGYSAEAATVIGYVKTYDDSEGQHFTQNDNITGTVVHMRSNDYVISFAKDEQYTNGLDSTYSCFNFVTGADAFIAASADILAQINPECVSEGAKPPGDGIYALQSYNYPNLYLSHGNPSFITDDHIAFFYFEEGLIGDPDTVSLRSAQQLNGVEKVGFYWRHANQIVREMFNDDSELFHKDSSWIIHESLFNEGTISLESANYRGYYIRHQNYVVRIAQDDGSQLFKDDASWIFQEQGELQPQELELVPVWRMYNEESGDTILTASDERVTALEGQGYTALAQEFQEGQDPNYTDDNIIGYVYNQAWDPISSPILEFFNESTGHHYYTTDSNNVPSEDYKFSLIIGYAYSMLYERTSAVYYFDKLTDPGTGMNYWTTSVYEKGTLSTTDYSYVGINFYVVNSPDDPCLFDQTKCGPIIPTPCPSAEFYRETQQDECIKCDGQIEFYTGDVVEDMYTAECHYCEGGFTKDEETGFNVCNECPNGQWVDVGDEYKACYPDCDYVTNHYLNISTLECQYCEQGELVPDEVLENVYTCQWCEQGIDVEVLCSDGLIETAFYVPNDCPQDQSEVSRRDVCKVCEYGPWTRNIDDGVLYCIKTCADPTFYVNDENQCEQCVNGLLYDDNNGTKRCAPHVSTGPFQYPDDEEETYHYTVPSNQLDDITQFGFFLWVRNSFLNPKYFNFNSFEANNARVAGFVSHYTESQKAFGSGLLGHYYLHGNVIDSENGYNGQNFGAVGTENRFGTKNAALKFDNSYLHLPASLVDGLSDFTFSYWLKLDPSHITATYQFVVSLASGSSYNNEFLTSFGAICVNEECTYPDNQTGLANDVWTHVLYTRSGGQVYNYVDGALSTSQTLPSVPLGVPDNGFVIGQDQDKVGGGFDATQALYGSLSDFRIYDRAFSAQEAQSLYLFELDNDLNANYNGASTGGNKPVGLQSSVRAHADSSVQEETLVFAGSNNVQQFQQYPTRRDFDGTWTQIFMAQGSNGKAVAYSYFADSKTASTIVFDSPSSILTSLSFYLGRRIGANVFANLGFQGTYTDINLRFGRDGIFWDTQAGVEAYLANQGSPQQPTPLVQLKTHVYEIYQQSVEINLDDLTVEERTHRFTELHGTEEYAVFGWFKHDSTQPLSNKQSLFNLKDQPNTLTSGDWGISLKAGDIALAAEYCISEHLDYGTYTTSPNAQGESTQEEYLSGLSFEQDDVDHWFFMYVAYSRKDLASWTYTRQLLNNDDNWVVENQQEFWHLRPDEQVLTLGHYPSSYLDSTQFSSFHGQVYNIRVQYGNVCRPHDYDCMLPKWEDKPTPDPFGQCVILYSKPNYEGDFVFICDEREQFNLTPESIYVPEGIKFRLWESPYFDGLTVEYFESFDNIGAINFSLLLQGKVKGANLIENAKYQSFLAKKLAETEKKETVQEKVTTNATIALEMVTKQKAEYERLQAESVDGYAKALFERRAKQAENKEEEPVAHSNKGHHLRSNGR